MSEALSPAFRPAFRLIPSQFPPIPLFDTVARAADLPAVMDLAGWTNDRLVEHRLHRLPQDQWVYGRPNSSIVMAAFLHAAPSRFNGPDLGAWYAADRLSTAAAEVGHHLRREAVARRLPEARRNYRTYTSRLEGDFVDLRGRRAERPDAYDSANYAAAQLFGEAQRAAGRDGLLYDSLRLAGGQNACAYRPPKVLDVVQADHFEITVSAMERRIEVRRLASGAARP